MSANKMNNDASWIRKTLRKKSIRDFKKAKAQFLAAEKGGSKAENGFEELGIPSLEAEKEGRAAKAERRATLKEKKLELQSKRRESKKKLDEMRQESKTMKKKKSLAKTLVDDEGKANTKAPETTEETVEGDGEEEEESEYDSEYDSEEDSSEEEEEEDISELNEMNFNKLLQIRVQSTDFQLESFCTKYIFTLEEKGVKELHGLADDFEHLCKSIYEPMLLKNSPKNRKKTLRKLTVLDVEAMKQLSLIEKEKPAVKIPKEVPIEHEITVDFFKAHDISFPTEAAQKQFYEGLHIESSCCFFQFLLLKFRNMIIDQYCDRWEKKRDEVEEKNLGSLILEEFFMPPMKVEPKLDQELVKFSKLMSSRQFEINQYRKKMMDKDPKSVAFNILQKEMLKYIKQMEDKINVSEIYFSAAIMKVRQQQQRELERIYELIEAEEEGVAEGAPVVTETDDTADQEDSESGEEEEETDDSGEEESDEEEDEEEEKK